MFPLTATKHAPVKKIHVLDTNVLLHDPTAIFKFEDNEVVIPIFVIEEVDTFKREMSERGRNARQVVRYLDDLREKSGGSLQHGVVLGESGRLRVGVPENGNTPSASLPRQQTDGPRDHGHRPRHPGRKPRGAGRVCDDGFPIFAFAQTPLGLRAETYEGGRIAVDELYTGIVQIEVAGELVDQLGGRTDVPVAKVRDGFPSEVHPNQCVVLRDQNQRKHTALGRVDGSRDQVRPLRGPREGAWGRAAAKHGTALRARPLAESGHPSRYPRGQSGHGYKRF